MAEVMDFIDGFDDYSVAADVLAGGWTFTGSGGIAAGNVAGSCFTPPANNGKVTHALTSDSYIHHLFHWRPVGSGISSDIWRLFEGNTEHIRLSYNGNGTFTLSRAGTTVGTIPTSGNLGIVNLAWYHVEVFCRIHDTAGFYSVYINGVLACDGGGSALDTRNGGAAGVADNMALTQPAVAQNAYDDFIAYHGSGAAQKGIARVWTGLPAGDGAHSDMAASAGSDYQCVDDAAPNGDTDYISSSTVNHIDTFTYPAMGLSGTVLGVAPTSLARKDDAGTRIIRELIRRSGVDYLGAADKSLVTTYANYQEIWETDPAGGAWSVAAIDAAEFGVKLTA